MLKTLFLLLICAHLGGCSTVLVLNQVENYDANLVSIEDNRPMENRESRRDSVFSAIAFYADDKIRPPVVEILKSKLTEIAKNEKLAIVIEELRVLDYFPNRLGAGGPGVMGNEMFRGLMGSNTDWGFVEELGVSTSQDSIICFFIGTVNDKQVKAAAYREYALSPFAGLVVNDPSFKQAAQDAIDELAHKIFLGYKSSD